MTEKIILNILEKSKWPIFYSVIIFMILYQYTDTFIFIYLLFVQIWLIYDNYDIDRLKEANDCSAELINKIKSDFDLLKEDMAEIIKLLDKEE
jgi:hypothetical protein